MFRNRKDYKIVYQQNHVEIYEFGGGIPDNNVIIEWVLKEYEEEELLDEDNVIDDEERAKAQKDREIMEYLTGPAMPSEGHKFLAAWCPLDEDTFGTQSPRSVSAIFTITGNTLYLAALGLTVQGFNHEVSQKRYRRQRSNSTEPMMEATFLYFLQRYPELKYGAVQGSDGANSLLEVWFDLHFKDDDDDFFHEHEDIDDLSHQSYFLLITPYFKNLLRQKRTKQDQDIQCRMCHQISFYRCGNYCSVGFYCGSKCQQMDWKRHQVYCKK